MKIEEDTGSVVMARRGMEEIYDKEGKFVATEEHASDSDVVQMVMCDCHSEGITVLLVDDDTDDMAYFTIMAMYRHMPMGLWNRIRYCWKILRTGKPYGDQICMRRPALQALGVILNRMIDVLKKREEKIKDANKHGNK